MTSDRIRDWISIIANVGVLIGLIMVAVQIQQGSDSLRGSSYQTWLAANVELNSTLTQLDQGGRFADGNFDSRSLDEDSFMAFAMWNYSFFQMVQATNYMYQEGSLDRDLWEAEIERAAGFLGLPGVRQLWDAGMRTQLTPDFVALVERATPAISYWDWDAERGFYAGGPDGD